MDLPVLPILGFVAFIVGLILLARYQAKKRREALQQLATSLGFSFEPFPDRSAQHALMDRYGQFSPFGQGEQRKVDNLLTGSRNGRTWEIFDYQYVTRSTDSEGKEQTTTHSFGVAVVRTDVDFPMLTLSKETMGTRLASMVGFKDVEFEYEAFNKRYRVGSKDKKRTMDLIHPQAIEFLMEMEPPNWEFCGPYATSIRHGANYRLEEIPGAMERLEKFLDLIPPYYRQDNPAR